MQLSYLFYTYRTIIIDGQVRLVRLQTDDVRLFLRQQTDKTTKFRQQTDKTTKFRQQTDKTTKFRLHDEQTVNGGLGKSPGLQFSFRLFVKRQSSLIF